MGSMALNSKEKTNYHLISLKIKLSRKFAFGSHPWFFNMAPQVYKDFSFFIDVIEHIFCHRG